MHIKDWQITKNERGRFALEFEVSEYDEDVIRDMINQEVTKIQLYLTNKKYETGYMKITNLEGNDPPKLMWYTDHWQGGFDADTVKEKMAKAEKYEMLQDILRDLTKGASSK